MAILCLSSYLARKALKYLLQMCEPSTLMIALSTPNRVNIFLFKKFITTFKSLVGKAATSTYFET